jgi:hypothetical protein
MILFIEAARQCCGGSLDGSGPRLARDLALAAIRELEAGD